jgi:hypothetical protein
MDSFHHDVIFHDLWGWKTFCMYIMNFFLYFLNPYFITSSMILCCLHKAHYRTPNFVQSWNLCSQIRYQCLPLIWNFLSILGRFWFPRVFPWILDHLANFIHLYPKLTSHEEVLRVVHGKWIHCWWTKIPFITHPGIFHCFISAIDSNLATVSGSWFWPSYGSPHKSSFRWHCEFQNRLAYQLKVTVW